VTLKIYISQKYIATHLMYGDWWYNKLVTTLLQIFHKMCQWKNRSIIGEDTDKN